MEKKTKVIIVAIISLLIVTMIGATYAYFTANETGSESVSTLKVTGGTLNIAIAGGNTIQLDNAYPRAAAWGTKTFTVTGNNTSNMEMYYKVSLVVDANEFNNGSITYSLTGTNTSSNGTLISNITNKGINTGTNTIALGLGKFAGVVTNAVHTYSLSFYYPKTETNQNAEQGSKMAAHIVIEGVQEPIGTNIIKSKVGTTTNGGLKVISQPATIQTEALTEYRYYGANPDNYISFNDELWRIIGVFNVEGADGKKEQRIKIARGEVLDYYSWDRSASDQNSGEGINAWSQSDMMKLINPGYETNQDLDGSSNTILINNSLYYNSGSGTCYYRAVEPTTACDFTSTGIKETSKHFIADTKYYTAGYSDNSSTPAQIYSYERGNNLTVVGTSCSGKYCNDTYTRTTSWIGKIGLVYVSDYGYAVDETLCGATSFEDYTSDSCTTNNWLYSGLTGQWTMTPWLTWANAAVIILARGDLDIKEGYQTENFRPVLYLKSDVKITSGEGTSTNPYVIQ